MNICCWYVIRVKVQTFLSYQIDVVVTVGHFHASVLTINSCQHVSLLIEALVLFWWKDSSC